MRPNSFSRVGFVECWWGRNSAGNLEKAMWRFPCNQLSIGECLARLRLAIALWSRCCLLFLDQHCHGRNRCPGFTNNILSCPEKKIMVSNNKIKIIILILINRHNNSKWEKMIPPTN